MRMMAIESSILDFFNLKCNGRRINKLCKPAVFVCVDSEWKAFPYWPVLPFSKQQRKPWTRFSEDALTNSSMPFQPFEWAFLFIEPSHVFKSSSIEFYMAGSSSNIPTPTGLELHPSCRHLRRPYGEKRPRMLSLILKAYSCQKSKLARLLRVIRVIDFLDRIFLLGFTKVKTCSFPPAHS